MQKNLKKCNTQSKALIYFDFSTIFDVFKAWNTVLKSNCEFRSFL